MLGNMKLFLVLNRISHSFALLTREISWSTLKITFHISAHPCIILYLYNEYPRLDNQIHYYKSKYEKVRVLPIRIIKSNVASVDSKRQTLLSVLAVHQRFHISICISTLSTQHITFIINLLLSRLNDRISCERFSFQDYRTPWKSIFSSTCFWAIAVAHYCCNWGFYTLLTSMPAYFKEVLGVHISEVGGIHC